MWTIFSERELALDAAIHNRVHELEVYEAYLLDNERRHDMGYPSITFEQFLECVNHPMHCVPDGKDCKE